ncbi:MAG: distal tail protein Dit [Candidatus Pacearchaeota archaeon]
MSAKSITFNGQSLQDSYFLTKDIIYRNLPAKTLDIEPYSRRDGYRLVNSYYNQKDIVVSGTITRDTEANLKISIDTMKSLLSVQEGNLDIGDGATTMRFVGSVASIEIPEEHYHITTVPFKITFRCQPFGKTTSQTTLTRSISASSSSSFSTSGSAPTLPIFKWICVGTPSAPITQIALNVDFSPYSSTITVPSLALDAEGDYLEIDVSAMTVKVSHDGGAATEIDYSGVFPFVGAGSNTYVVTITGGGTFSLTETIKYYPSYL